MPREIFTGQLRQPYAAVNADAEEHHLHVQPNKALGDLCRPVGLPLTHLDNRPVQMA